MDIRKWSAMWRNRNIFRYISLIEFNRGAKAVKAARGICTVYGDNAIRESMARKWFSHFKKDFLTLVTFHVQEDIQVLMKIV